MLSSMLFLTGGAYLYWEGRKGQTWFGQLEKHQIYDFNHLKDVQDLPITKDVFLGGIVNHSTKDNKDILYSHQVNLKNKDDDHMWLSKEALQ